MTILSSKHYDRSLIPALLKQAVTKANSIAPTGTTGFPMAVPQDADPNRWGPILSTLANLCNGLTGPTGTTGDISINRDKEPNEDSQHKNGVTYTLKRVIDVLNLH